MKTILQNSLSVCLCLSLFACGSHTKGKDPLPLTKPTTTMIGPTVIVPATPSTPVTPITPVETAALTEVPVMGTPETFEIGTWNIEDYPKAAGSRALVSQILNKLDVDVMAVEEISSLAEFNALVAEMPQFTGILAPESGSQLDERNVGFIYRSSDFTLVKSEALFEKEGFAFPRPPLMIRLHPLAAGRADVVAIAVHLKAFGDDKSQQRREIANTELEAYVSGLKAQEPNLQIVVLGDFNQPLIEAAERKVFNPWFDKASSYTVRTDALVKKGDYSYFAGRFSLIDHMITTNDFLLTEPVIVKLQTVVPNYATQASDHLPVIARLQ